MLKCKVIKLKQKQDGHCVHADVEGVRIDPKDEHGHDSEQNWEEDKLPNGREKEKEQTKGQVTIEAEREKAHTRTGRSAPTCLVTDAKLRILDVVHLIHECGGNDSSGKGHHDPVVP
eukprot:119545-Prymnesium_polylepis.1